jgi:excisionase family DNA binding protein
MQKLLTIDELASLLKVPRSYIYENKIPGKIKLGARTVRYDAEVIERWLAKQVESSNGEGVMEDALR